MPSELYTFVLYLIPSEIRSRGCSTDVEVMSEVAAREYTWKTCHTNAVPSLLGCYSCCCYGNKVWGCCGTIIKPSNAAMESFLSICTQYTLCKYVALTFTEPWFIFCFQVLFQPTAKELDTKSSAPLKQSLKVPLYHVFKLKGMTLSAKHIIYFLSISIKTDIQII